MLLDTQVLLEAVDNNVEWSKFKHLLKLKKKIIISIRFCLYLVVKKVVNKLRQQSETKKGAV